MFAFPLWQRCGSMNRPRHFTPPQSARNRSPPPNYGCHQRPQTKSQNKEFRKCRLTRQIDLQCCWRVESGKCTAFGQLKSLFLVCALVLALLRLNSLRRWRRLAAKSFGHRRANSKVTFSIVLALTFHQSAQFSLSNR